MIQMQETSTASICKVCSPFQFILKDQQQHFIKIQIKPTNNKYYHHLLPTLLQSPIKYSLLTNNHPLKLKEQFKKGTIYLDGQIITKKYAEKWNRQYLTTEIKSQSVLNCFVLKVECLKLDLIDLSNLKCITFYFSDLKLIRLGNIHPKQMWERAHSYFQEEIQGQFIQLTVNGSQNYKEEVNIYGQLIRLRDQANIKEKIINDGYAELSKNSEKYLSAESIKYFNELRDKAKAKSKGMWQTSKNITKSILQVQQFKYKQWEEWIGEKKKVGGTKSDEEIKDLGEELFKLCKSHFKIQYNKVKIVLDAIVIWMQEQVRKKGMKVLQEVIKILCNFLNNLYISISQHIGNIDFIKSLNKILIFLNIYHHEYEKNLEANRQEKLTRGAVEGEFQKVIKLVFKLCFLGNQAFHDKIFGQKKKQYNYEHFSFDNAHLQGFSSLSECSDYQEADKLSKDQKRQRKIYSSHQKIRINATNLLSNMFKHYTKLTETYWEMCVTSSILSSEFLSHVKKLRITTEEVKMSEQQKKEIANLIRSNFGDHCIILLSIFERNTKVRLNSIDCLLNMITNFQSKKLIAAAERAYVEKLLVSTKSSFIPKSFIVFSGLRNALYFLLFTLYYEKNVPIIIMIFKTLCELCNNCTLIDKMSFEEGMGLLMSNYILPVLQFQWSISELEELKILCINFLSVLVTNNRRWIEIEESYFKGSQKNINLKLIQVLRLRKSSFSNVAEDKVITQILIYFTKLSKKYFSIIFFKINDQMSIWDHLQELFINNIHTRYSQFIQSIFKGYLDEIQNIEQSRTAVQTSVKQTVLAEFMVNFIKYYSKDVSPSNYIHLLATITYINYDQWSKTDFQYVKDFLLHCFFSFAGGKHEGQKEGCFSSISDLKSNSLVRVGLIKLVGYMSFCREFHSEEIIKKSIELLLQMSRLYKSFNSIVKITWGLSNWVKVDHFYTYLSEEEIKQCLEYLVRYSASDKQKIASNCTRGIGFFVSNIRNKLDLNHIRKHIINNIAHSIIKVRTNTTKTLISIYQQLTEQQIKNLVPVIEQNILKNNYHLQMETLTLLKKLKYPIKGQRLFALFVGVLKNLLSNTTLEYEFSQIKTVKQLRFSVLSEIFSIQFSQYIKSEKGLAKDILISIYAYLIKDCREDGGEGESIKNFDKQFQRSEEAREVVFNKVKSSSFGEQNIIQSQLISKGFVFKTRPHHLQLITSIKTFSQQFSREHLQVEWQALSRLKVQGDNISLNFSALQLSEIHQELKDLLQVQR